MWQVRGIFVAATAVATVIMCILMYVMGFPFIDNHLFIPSLHLHVMVLMESHCGGSGIEFLKK